MAHQVTRAAVNHGTRVLSVLEKAKLVCWFEETHSFAQVARRYRAAFGMEPPQLDQVKKLHQRFLSTGSILNGSGGNIMATTFSNLDANVSGLVGEQQQTQQIPIVSDAAGLDAEEQLRMARM